MPEEVGHSTRRMQGPALSDEANRQRLEGQVRIVQDQLGDDEVDFDSDEAADFSYLHRRGALLVRDADLDRVSSVVAGEVRDSLIGGISLFQATTTDTAAALDLIDNALGPGV